MLKYLVTATLLVFGSIALFAVCTVAGMIIHTYPLIAIPLTLIGAILITAMFLYYNENS